MDANQYMVIQRFRVGLFTLTILNTSKVSGAPIYSNYDCMLCVLKFPAPEFI
jgi:hypothetical protein